jgi:hypothetical protein
MSLEMHTKVKCSDIGNWNKEMKHVDTRTETRENIAPFSNREREKEKKTI